MNLAESAFSGNKVFLMNAKLRAGDSWSCPFPMFSSSMLGTSMLNSAMIWSASFRLSEERRGASGLIYKAVSYWWGAGKGECGYIGLFFEHVEMIMCNDSCKTCSMKVRSPVVRPTDLIVAPRFILKPIKVFAVMRQGLYVVRAKFHHETSRETTSPTLDSPLFGHSLTLPNYYTLDDDNKNAQG